MRTICQSNPANPPESFVFDDLGFPGGAYDFVIIADAIGATIDESGVVTVESNDLPVGLYAITIQYKVMSGEEEITETTTVTFAMIDCYEKLLEENFILCGLGGTTQYQQLQFNTGKKYSDWNVSEIYVGIAISPTGLLTITTDEITPGNFTFSYDADAGKEVTINISIVDCVNPTHQAFTECEKEPVGIVWVNQEGGRQGYYFNQPKDYNEDQEDGQTWDNGERERRYFTRGRVTDATTITQENIPIEHLTSLRSLKRAIQAWECDDIYDRTTYRAIIVEAGDVFIRRTSDRFYSFTFKYTLAIPRLIQRQ